MEGIFTTTPDGRFVSANPALVRLLGFRDEGDLVSTLRDTARQLYVDPHRREAFVRAVLEGGSVTGFAAEVRRKDGSTLWMELTARAVRDVAGRLVAFQGTAQDVTERHRAAEALRHAKEQADMANRAKSEFLANMSHELRTPLNAIIGFSEIIGNQTLGPIDDPSYAEYARDIHDSGKLLLDLINDILDLSKIGSGKKELHERSVDVPRVIWSCLRLVRERALAGGITLETDLPESLPPVRADEVALKQVLSNLLTNAVKFTPAGGRVTAGARVAPDGRLMLTVRDTGIGMDPDDIPRAMEPFRQLDSHLTRAAGGAGLGLPLVQALVELHEGAFTLDSRKGEGTTATVWLPADRLQRLAATSMVPAR
ncbi:PAS domain-containing sensor histidine kinase [Aerophototrophica crusticola]|uniref:histidine kinase n=1 Tax=Aerophototrophica crusticola TaxID=1709002 RepID=A0A858RAV7_9PROT|nr:PAS domain-containing sensor histidine kinase [Rhodospirillaceae bacterium B3]